MNLAYKTLGLALPLLMMVTAGCGKKDSAEGGSLSLSLKLSGALSGAQSGRFSPNALTIGSNASSELQSMKYYISSITICESLGTSGSGFNNPSGCLAIYDNQLPVALSYNLSTVSSVDPNVNDLLKNAVSARSITDGYIDLMSATDRAKLSKSLTLKSDHVRSYNYGYMTWAPPVKIKGAFAQGGSTIYTKDGTTAATTGVEGPTVATGYKTAYTGDFTAQSTAEEAVILHSNGGNWFKFQNPLTITQADIDNKTNFKLDLAFNPEHLVKVRTDNTNGMVGNLMDTSGHLIDVPMVDLSPIPHRENETVKKEVYTATLTGTNPANVNGKYTVRLELYYIGEDSAKTIYGATVHTYESTGTVENFTAGPKVSTMTTSGGTMSFKGWDGSAFISDFTRKSAAGETTTATITCTDNGNGGKSGFFLDGCSYGETKSVTFTLDAVVSL